MLKLRAFNSVTKRWRWIPAPTENVGSQSEIHHFTILYTDIVPGPFDHGKVLLLTAPAFSQLQVMSWVVEEAFDDSGNLTTCSVDDTTADNQFSNSIDLTNPATVGEWNTIADLGPSIYTPTIAADVIFLVRNWQNDGSTGKLHLWVRVTP